MDGVDVAVWDGPSEGHLFFVLHVHLVVVHWHHGHVSIQRYGFQGGLWPRNLIGFIAIGSSGYILLLSHMFFFHLCLIYYLWDVMTCDFVVANVGLVPPSKHVVLVVFGHQVWVARFWIGFSIGRVPSLGWGGGRDVYRGISPSSVWAHFCTLI